MAGSSGAQDLLVKIGADTSDFKSSLEGMVENVTEWVGELDPLIAGVAVTIGGIAIAASDSAEQFETAMHTINVQTTATGTDLTGLEDTASTLFTTLPNTIGDISNALVTFHDKLSLSGDALQSVVTLAGQLSDITGSNFTTASQGMSQALAAWGVTNGPAAATALQDLYNVVQQTNVPLTTLSGTMSSVAMQAQTAGLNFQQTATIVGAFENVGGNAASAFQGLMRAQQQWTKAGNDGQVTFADLVNTIQNAIAAGGPTDGLNEAITLMGTRSGPKFFQMIADGKITLDTFSGTTLPAATKSIQDVYKETDTLGRSWTTCMNNLKEFLTPVGQFINSGLKLFLDGLNSSMSVMGGTFKSTNPDVIAASNATQNWLNQGLTPAKAILTDFIAKLPAASAPLKDLKDGMANAADAAQAMKDATSALKSGETELSSIEKALFVPTLTDVATAQANVTDARGFAQNSADKLKAAEQALSDYIANNSKPNTATLKTLTDDLNNARDDAKSDAENLKNAETDLQKSQAADKTAVADIASAETELSNAYKAVHIPTIGDVKTAEDAVVTARNNVKTSADNVKDAEDLLQALRSGPGVKSADALQNAEDNLKTAKDNLKTSVGALKTAETDLTTTHSLLQSATADLLGATKDLDKAYLEDFIPHTTDLKTAVGNLQDSYALLKSAEADVMTAQNNLTQAQVSGDPTALKNATDALKVSRDNLNLTLTQLHTNETQITSDFGLTKDQVDALKTSTDNATTSVGLADAALQALGVKPVTALNQLAISAQANFNLIANSGGTGAAQVSAYQANQAWINNLTATYNAIVASNGPTSVALAVSTQMQQAQTQQKYYLDQMTSGWQTMYNSIDGDINKFIGGAIQNLFTGNTSFKKLSEQFLSKMAGDIVSDLLAPWTKALANWVATTISDTLKPLGGWFSSMLPTGGGGNDTGTPGVDGLPGTDNGAGGGGGVGDIGSGLSGITGIIGAIGSIGSMITGAIGDIQNMHMEKIMGEVEVNTRYTQIALIGKLGVIDIMWIFNPFIQQSAQHLRVIMDDVDKKIGPAIGAPGKNGNISQILSGTQDRTIDVLTSMRASEKFLAQISKVGAPTVNVAVTLDGNAIAAAVTTNVEAAIKQQSGG